MKSQAKSINTANTASAGTPEQQDMKFPHASQAEPKRPSIAYLSMLKEIEKISDPVNFQQIKEFYNIE